MVRKDKRYRLIDDETLQTKSVVHLNDFFINLIKHKERYTKIFFSIISVFILFAVFQHINASNKIDHIKTSHDKEVVKLNDTIDSLTYTKNIQNIHTLIGKYAITKEKVVINKDTLWGFIVECGAWYPEIIIAQIEQESGIGKSNLAKKANNLCGMMKVSVRETTQRKDESVSGFGVYDNWHLSVLDRILYDYNRYGYKKPTKEKYLQDLASYGCSEDYIEKIRQMSRKYEKEYKK